MRECPQCGTPFVKKGRRIYCSVRCSRIYHHDLRPVRVFRPTCNGCGIEFKPKSNSQLYCTRTCRGANGVVRHGRKKTHSLPDMPADLVDMLDDSPISHEGTYILGLEEWQLAEMDRFRRGSYSRNTVVRDESDEIPDKALPIGKYRGINLRVQMARATAEQTARRKGTK